METTPPVAYDSAFSLIPYLEKERIMSLLHYIEKYDADHGIPRPMTAPHLNAYHAALYQDYLCANKIPTGNAKQIVENIRYKRTAASMVR